MRYKIGDKVRVNSEAKPKSQSWDGLEPVVQIALSARRKALNQFEQNLLKALEEV